jgi:hypothetical protein
MSWAAKRETTRIEDRAYSLIGLLGLHMTMIYSEEGEAFERLQLEIIQKLPDQSIFAWRGSGDARGLLAKSPSEFAKLGHIRRMIYGSLEPFQMTQLGIKITLPISAKLFRMDRGQPAHYMYLNCCGSSVLNSRNGVDHKGRIAIHVAQKRRGDYSRMVRVNCDWFEVVSELPTMTYIVPGRSASNTWIRSRAELATWNEKTMYFENVFKLESEKFPSRHNVSLHRFS